jgi:hypothetical protein
MPTRFATLDRPSTRPLETAARTLARSVLTIFVICLVAALALGLRYVLFEYSHGDRQFVQRLLVAFLP